MFEDRHPMAEPAQLVKHVHAGEVCAQDDGVHLGGYGGCFGFDHQSDVRYFIDKWQTARHPDCWRG